MLTKVVRVVRVLTLPETRGVILAAARSDGLRDVARRATDDRAALLRDLTNPANARAFLQSAVRHPATRELADAGVLLLPARYLPVGWAATWVARKLMRRYETAEDGSRRTQASGLRPAGSTRAR
jgi:hypothetical protein